MKQRMRASILVKVGALGAVAVSGCAVIADLDHSYELSPEGGGGSVGSGGAGGAGGVGGSGGAAGCMPNEERPCYTGPLGTQDVGACKGGLETCASDGSGWGPCEGEILPVSETCATPVDDDCDGMVNEGGDGCNCTPGDAVPCYSGPDGTQNNPPCMAGTQMCNADGMGFGECMGEMPPGVESCATAADEDCDAAEASGGVDKDNGCVCFPGTMAACYSGPAGTMDVGLCKGGMTTCNADGKGWGGCIGEVVPKAEDCTTKMLDENCDNVVGELCPGETQWSKSAGDNANQEANGVGVDGAGNVIIAGGFTGTIDLGGGPLTSVMGSRDVFVAKFSPSGMHLWSKRFGDAGFDTAAAVAVTPAGEIVVTGTFDSATIDFGGGPRANVQSTDGFVAKLDGQGGHVWSVVYGANGPQQPTSVAVSLGGDVYVCGGFGGQADFGTGANLTNAGNSDYFLLKLAGNTGATTWAKSFGDPDNQAGCSVAVDNANNPIIAVPLFGTVNFGGVALAAQNLDIGIAKFTSGGAHSWSKRYGDGDIQDAKGVAVDSLDRVLVTGTFKGSVNFGPGNATANGYDAYVLRLTSAGNYDTHKVIGDVNDQFGVDVAVGESDSIVVVGDFDAGINFGAPSMPVSASSDEGYVAKYDSMGGYLWHRALIGSGAQQPLGVATMGSGNVALAGSFSTGIDFGGGNQHMNAGNLDIFVALLQK